MIRVRVSLTNNQAYKELILVASFSRILTHDGSSGWRITLITFSKTKYPVVFVAIVIIFEIKREKPNFATL